MSGVLFTQSYLGGSSGRLASVPLPEDGAHVIRVHLPKGCRKAAARPIVLQRAQGVVGPHVGEDQAGLPALYTHIANMHKVAAVNGHAVDHPHPVPAAEAAELPRPAERRSSIGTPAVRRPGVLDGPDERPWAANLHEDSSQYETQADHSCADGAVIIGPFETKDFPTLEKEVKWYHQMKRALEVNPEALFTKELMLVDLSSIVGTQKRILGKVYTCNDSAAGGQHIGLRRRAARAAVRGLIFRVHAGVASRGVRAAQGLVHVVQGDLNCLHG